MYIPPELSVDSNGCISTALLQEIGPGCFLYKRAAAAWEKLCTAARHDGFELKPINSRSCYRTVKEQEDVFLTRYEKVDTSGQGTVIWRNGFWKRKPGFASAAVPGTSDHGLGLAINVAQMRRGGVLLAWMLQHAYSHGWCWRFQNQPWHLVYVGAGASTASTRTIRYTPEDVAEFLCGTWRSQPPQGSDLTGLMCSPKNLNEGSLLVLRSLKERYSPGTTLARLRQEKVSAEVPLLTDRPTFKATVSNPVLQVKSLTAAVERWICRQRKGFAGRLLTVSGSAGKTTTATMLSKALRRHGRCLSSVFTNVMDGIYPAALKLDSQDFAVFETAQGSLPRSAETLAADVAILVSIAPAHMDRHASLEDLARCKAGLFAGATPGSIAVINRDIPYFDIVRAMAEDYGRTVLTYGKTDDADFRLLRYLKEETAFEFIANDQIFKVKQAVLGEHISLNALAVITAMHALGLNWPAELHCFSTITQPPPGRGDVHDFLLADGSCKVMNHAYNANPASAHASLATLSDYPTQKGGRRVAVLGDMLEMGDTSEQLHSALAGCVLASKIQLLILVGKDIRTVRAGLPSDFPCIEFSTVELLFETLPSLLRPKDVVLFNGSNGTGLNDALKNILNNQTQSGKGIAMDGKDDKG